MKNNAYHSLSFRKRAYYKALNLKSASSTALSPDLSGGRAVDEADLRFRAL